jgi:hypothetical protein
MPFAGIRRQPLYGKWMVSSLNNDVRKLPGEADFALTNSADLPPRLFHCRLDDQPDHLVPERYLRDWAREDLSDRPLFINPECCFAPNGEMPAMVADSVELLENFALTADMVWINDQVRGTLLPFWLGPEFSLILAGLDPGEPAPSPLSQDTLMVLARAGILVPSDHLALRRRRWSDVVARCAAEFEVKRYTPIGPLIHPFHISALRRYYRHLIRQGKLKLGDSQSPRRYVAKDEPVARFFHHQLTAAVSRVVEEPVKPSYVYLGSYQGGAELEAHIDREQCEFSISLCIDYSPEPVRETPWPLQLHTATGKTTVFQGIGDALIYSGRELPHSRDRLPPGNTSTSLFFHYVRESFMGPLT